MVQMSHVFKMLSLFNIESRIRILMYFYIFLRILEPFLLHISFAIASYVQLPNYRYYLIVQHTFSPIVFLNHITLLFNTMPQLAERLA